MATEKRLLQAAAEEFAARGFQATTVADICRRAGANIAAVNYHFGSKEELYREAWRQAHKAACANNPPDGRVPPEAPAEDRLRGRLHALLARALREDDLELQIMERELLNPTGLLEQVICQTVDPLRRDMEQILKELLGARADVETVRLCVLSVIGPCMDLLRRPRHRLRPEPVPPAESPAPPFFGPDQLDILTEHCTGFALAGIRAIRERLEAKKPVTGNRAKIATRKTQRGKP